MPRVESGWNGGTGRELQPGQNMMDEAVYCTACGTIYIPSHPVRSCPACTLASALEIMAEEVYGDDWDFW